MAYLEDCRTPDVGDMLDTVTAEATRPRGRREQGSRCRTTPLPCTQPATCPEPPTANTSASRRRTPGKNSKNPLR